MKKVLISLVALGVLSCGNPPNKKTPPKEVPKEMPVTPPNNPPTTPKTAAAINPGEMPPVGATAPAIKLQNQRGETVDLASFIGKKAIVLYFYPKDDTPGCTVEAKDFRDRNAEIEALGAKVIGVSLDPLESHQLFADKYDLNFDILSDAEQNVAKAYGVLGTFGDSLITNRTTFLIGKDGTIKKIFTDVKVSVHGQEVVKALQEGLGG